MWDYVTADLWADESAVCLAGLWVDPLAALRVAWKVVRRVVQRV